MPSRHEVLHSSRYTDHDAVALQALAVNPLVFNE